MASREPVEVEGGIRASVSLLRRNRDFRTLYVASVISLGGDWFLLVALFGLVLDATGSAISLGLLIAAQEIPFFLMSPIGGHLVDRLNRKWLMVVCDLVRAGLCLGFLFVRDANSVWLAYLLLATISSFTAAFDPATEASLPNLVEPEDLVTANALAGSLWGTMLAVGAALGGIVAATLGRNIAFLVDAGSFALSGMLIAQVRRRFSEERDEAGSERLGIVQATLETVRYAKKDHRVLALLSVKAGFGLGAGVLILISVFAQEVFHRGEIGIGILMSARGVGALIGPFAARRMMGPEDRRLFSTIGLSLMIFGVAYAVLGVAPSLFLASLAVGVAHLGGGAQWTLSSYGLQRTVPDRIRGRIFAFDGALITLTLTVSSILTGWSAVRFGPRPTAIGLGAIALGYAAVWAGFTTDVRRATLLEGCGPAVVGPERAV
ncbi:MAG TPA: MFS transporter [Actinomycetota bacterium]